MSKYALAIRLLSEPRHAVKLAVFFIFSTMIAVNSREWFATAQSLPPDALNTSDAWTTCVVKPKAFDTWFESGSVTVDGVVKPADGLAFPDIPNCSFFQRSWQMFLWLTSPAPTRYGGGGGRIFNSPAFYDVSPPDPNSGERTFIPHKVNGGPHDPISVSGVRVAQRGPNNLPVVLSKQRKILEVAPQKFAPSGNPLFTDCLGREVEVEVKLANVGAKRKLLLFDKSGNVIRFPNQNAKIKARCSVSPIVQRFIVNGNSVFVDSFGNIINVEVGQAEVGEVLMTKNMSLIYYTTAVNDVYAYFLTGAKNGGIMPAPSRFPTTSAELNNITKFALKHGKTLIDPNALAVEIKASWIEAAELPDLSSYITIWAKIPTYNKSSTEWIPTGKTCTKQLALIGLHVVGSASGHPEMIWATFEHFGNTPNAKYKYNLRRGKTKNVKQDAAGNWLFCGTCTEPFNVSRVLADGNALRPGKGYDTIGPSDVLRVNPWGAPGVSAAINTEIISINNSVRGMLHDGDVRKNYILRGATWTDKGEPPNKKNQVGTNRLANSTMETYQQRINCFYCHSGNKNNMLGTLKGGGLSHIWGPLKPLF